jgi:hypothetical protein
MAHQHDLHNYLRDKGIPIEGINNVTDSEPEFFDMWYSKYAYFIEHIVDHKIPLWDDLYVTGGVNTIYYIAKLDEVMRYIRDYKYAESWQGEMQGKHRSEKYKELLYVVFAECILYHLQRDIVNFAAMPFAKLVHVSAEAFSAAIDAIKTIGYRTWMDVNKSVDSNIQELLERHQAWNWIAMTNITPKDTVHSLMSQMFIDMLRLRVIDEAHERFRPDTRRYVHLADIATRQHGMKAHPECDDYPPTVLKSILGTLFKGASLAQRKTLFNFENINTVQDELSAFAESLNGLTRNELCQLITAFGFDTVHQAVDSIPRIDDGTIGNATIIKHSVVEDLQRLKREAVQSGLRGIGRWEFNVDYPMLYELSRSLLLKYVNVIAHGSSEKPNFWCNFVLVVCLEGIVDIDASDTSTMDGYKKFRLYPGSVIKYISGTHFSLSHEYAMSDAGSTDLKTYEDMVRVQSDGEYKLIVIATHD